jgi:Prokaryotic lipoprotein-attachment site
MTATRQALLVAVAVLALAGCGRSGDRADVRSVAESFYASVDGHEGARACAWLSPGARQAVEQDQSEPCARAVEQLKLSGRSAQRVEVYSTNAAVALRGGDVVYLETTPQGWRISAAGCRDPAYATPATCELQS